MNKKLEKQMNQYVSNLGVAYIKAHNLHWNISGKDFMAVHMYLEKMYECYTKLLDEAAEMLRMQQSYPVASMKTMLEQATIEERDSSEINTQDALASCLEDLKELNKQADEIRNASEEQKEYLITAMMEDNIAIYTKHIWMLESSLPESDS